jgi:hypothetical protein
LLGGSVENQHVRKGNLIFAWEDGTTNEIPVRYQLLEGVIAEGSKWRVSVNIMRGEELHGAALSFVERYVHSPSATLRLQIDEEVDIPCSAILERPEGMEDLLMWGFAHLEGPEIKHGFLR